MLPSQATVNLECRKRKMHLIFGSCSKPETSCDFSFEALPAAIPDTPFKPLEFWCITAHDRKSLLERIIPYMVSHLPEGHLLQTVVAEHGWSCAIFFSRTAQTCDNSVSCWQRVVTEFWENPSQTTERILLLAQAWFYTLLRYIYRMRFSARGKRIGSDVLVGDIHSCTADLCTSGLTKHEIYRLTGIPNKYGATFYRSCYKDVQRCSDWKAFCESISGFFKSIHFPSYSDSPEQILKELRGNLPSAILQRRWCHTTARLVETSHLATDTAEYVNKIDAKVESEGLANLQRIKQMEQEIASLHVHFKRLSLACETMVECKRSIATFTDQVKGIRVDRGGTNAINHASSSIEDIVACRWLLENLPVTSGTRKGFGIRWRSFWQLQWNQCGDNVNGSKHPLRTLKGDERYKRIGKNLYGTLSNVLHGYGQLRNVPLHPDVQTLVKTIGPVHYNKDKTIDIEAERSRWLPGGKKKSHRRKICTIVARRSDIATVAICC